MGKANDYDLPARQRIARHIKALFERMGETQQQFADRWGVSRPTVTNVKNGNAKGIGLDLFLKAVNNLGLDPLIMIKREPENQRSSPVTAPRMTRAAEQ